MREGRGQDMVTLRVGQSRDGGYLGEEGVRRLILVSNRAAYALKEQDGKIEGVRTVSGLVSAVEPIIRATGGVWVAWGGRCGRPGEKGVSLEVPFEDPSYRLQEVLLTEEEVENYYHGFANSCLWPLCHCFLEKCQYDPKYWETYLAVNRKFAAITLAQAEEGDLIFVQDFHLAMVPEEIRRLQRDAHLAMFWHIPFPPYDIFATLPWAREVLKGMLGCDFIAFHVPSYVDNFLFCVQRMLKVPVNFKDNTISWEGRTIGVQALPIGVDCELFASLARKPEIQQRAKEIRERIGSEIIILGVDRLDYTKGIPERLKAIEIFLAQNPDLRSRVTFLQVAVPTRVGVEAYQQLKQKTEETVGRINGLYSDSWHVPVRYIFKGLNQEELVAHYLAADVALVTPLRDGLNLVAKEYVASRINGDGVLILSSFAGAAEQMKDALLTNPYDPEDVAAKIKLAVTMPENVRRQLMARLREQVQKYSLQWWWQSLLKNLQMDKNNKIIAAIKANKLLLSPKVCSLTGDQDRKVKA